MLRCGFVEGVDDLRREVLLVGRVVRRTSTLFVLTNKTRRSIVLLVKQVRGLADLVLCNIMSN